MPPLPTLQQALALVTPLLVYQITASVFVVYSLVNATADHFAFRKPTATAISNTPLPSLSVLIPARNEEASIEPCVRSLLAAGYSGRLEILVLDDRSEDATGKVVNGLSAEDKRVHLLNGGELSPGWKGKPNALHQLAEAATGEMLLLTDADCIFLSGSLTNAVRYREQTGADCLSLMPYLVCGSFWEHVIIPLQYFLVFTTLPIRSIYASRNPAFAAANGAFILISAATYKALGGHAAVKGEMAEDIKFAQYVKERGKKLVYADGSTTYQVRMYESLPGIWQGFSKNMFPAMGKSIGVLLFWLFFQLTTQILPFFWLTVALIRHDYGIAAFTLPLLHVIIALGIRFALSLRFRQATWATLTHPIGWLIVATIAIYSAYLGVSGKGHTWKGRMYQS